MKRPRSGRRLGLAVRDGTGRDGHAKADVEPEGSSRPEAFSVNFDLLKFIFFFFFF